MAKAYMLPPFCTKVALGARMLPITADDTTTARSPGTLKTVEVAIPGKFPPEKTALSSPY